MRRMKTIILGLALGVLLVFGGCTQSDNDQKPAAGEQTNTQDKSSEDNKKEEQEEKKETDKAEEKDEEIVITVYYPNENADGVEKEEMKSQLTPESIWELLKSKEVVAENTAVNRLEQEGNTLKLDVNEAFGEQLRSYGTAGENMLMESVVNTFLDAYGCEQIQITENGATLVSGHREYADMIHKYE